MKTPLKKGLGSYTKKSKGNRGYKMSGPSLLKMVEGSGGKTLGTLANMFMAGINNVYGNPSEKSSSDVLNKKDAEIEALKKELTIAQKIIKGENT